jgi:Sulfotransferase family
MLGQHPEMYGLPELQLFLSDRMSEWWNICLQASFPMADGLVRAVAELIYGAQTEENVMRAQGWIRRRFHLSTGRMQELLAEIVAPRIVVEKSPSTVYNRLFLQRAGAMFPDARYIHLVRHPRGNGESILKAIRELELGGVPMQWLIDLASYPTIAPNQLPDSRNKATELDPQRGWYVLNQNIRSFLRKIPEKRKLQIRGEDVLSNPDDALRNIAAWLGLSTDAEAISAMKHPEQSSYARLGPLGAQYGNDPLFIREPALRPARLKTLMLEGPLEWLKDGGEFLPEVKKLAVEFGYS